MPNYILDNALDKSYGQYVFILLIAITILFVATYINKKIKNPDEHFGGDSNNKKMYWSRNTCKYEMGKTFENELKNRIPESHLLVARELPGVQGAEELEGCFLARADFDAGVGRCGSPSQ